MEKIKNLTKIIRKIMPKIEPIESRPENIELRIKYQRVQNLIKKK